MDYFAAYFYTNATLSGLFYGKTKYIKFEQEIVILSNRSADI